MSDTNQELVRALKLLSTQYEQQFSEVSQQIQELGEQIILLTNSTTQSSNNTSNASKDKILALVEDSACKHCDNAMFAIKKGASAPKFECLIASNITSPVDHCSKQT
jgi:hypothetical protein